ncbi:MAG: FtsQ-type POTRA domain-containing protein [Treponema sp.]|nr:FtsQ-type POTRA domain-containing protein [Treponema sp.]
MNSDKENSKKATWIEKLIRWILVLACIAAGFVLVWLVGVTPFLPFSRIDVSEIDGLSREYILMHTGMKTGASYISTDTGAIENALMVLPQIEYAQVFKHFPDRLEIALEGRKPVAMAFARSAGKTISVYFDAGGVIFGIGKGRDKPHKALPVISGLELDDPYLGMRLPSAVIPVLSQIENLNDKSPELLTAVSEIRINHKTLNGFDFVIYPAHRRIRIRLSELNEDILRNTLLLIDVLSSREPGISFIDFRSGIASYNPAANDHGMGGFLE